MAEIPDEDDLQESRAALSPTMDAMASILPWVGKTPPARFPPELNKRWQSACRAFADRWQSHGQREPGALRAEIFALLPIALESGDPACLHLCETLASAADRLEHGAPGNRLSAALAATAEALTEAGGLENPHLAERMQHLVQRLETALRPSPKPGERSDVLDRLFVQDAEDAVARMHEALEVLPIDVYAIELEATELIQHAEQIEMWGIYHLARQVQSYALQLADASEATQDQAARNITQQLDLISAALREIDY